MDMADGGHLEFWFRQKWCQKWSHLLGKVELHGVRCPIVFKLHFRYGHRRPSWCPDLPKYNNGAACAPSDDKLLEGGEHVIVNHIDSFNKIWIVSIFHGHLLNLWRSRCRVYTFKHNSERIQDKYILPWTTIATKRKCAYMVWDYLWLISDSGVKHMQWPYYSDRVFYSFLDLSRLLFTLKKCHPSAVLGVSDHIWPYQSHKYICTSAFFCSSVVVYLCQNCNWNDANIVMTTFASKNRSLIDVDPTITMTMTMTMKICLLL